MTSAVQQTPAKRSASVFVTPSPSSRYYREAKDYSPTNEQSKKSTIYSEQKQTIEALSRQIEQYQDRDLRQRKEIERMHGLLSLNETDAMRHLSQEVSRLTKLSSESENKRYELEQQVEEAKASIRQFSLTIESLEHEMKQKQHELESEIDHLNSEKTALSQKLDANSSLAAEYRDLQHVHASCSSKIQALEAEQSKYVMTIQTLQQENASHQKKDEAIVMTTLKSELMHLRESMKRQYIDEHDDMTELIKNLRSEIAQERTRVLNVERTRETLANKVNQLTEELETSNHQLKAIRETVARKEREMQEIQNCREALSGTLVSGFKELLENDGSRALERQVEQLKATNMELNGKVAMAEHQNECVAKLQEEVNKLRTELRTCDMDRREKELESQRLSSLATEQEKQLTKLFELQQKYQNLRGIDTKHQELVQKYRIVSEEAEDRAHELAQVKAQLEEMRKERERLAVDRGRCSVLENEMKRMNEDRLRLENETTDLRRQVEEMKNDHQVALTREVGQLYARIQAAGKLNSELDRNLVGLTRKVETYQTDIIALRSVVNSYKESGERKTSTIESLQGQLTEQRELASKYEKQYQEVRATCYSEAFESQLKELEGVINEKNQILYKYENELNVLRSELKHHDAEELPHSQDTVRSLQDECAEYEARLERLSQQLNDRNDAIRKLKSAVRSLQRKCDVQMSTEQSMVDDMSHQLDKQKHLVQALRLQLQRCICRGSSLPSQGLTRRQFSESQEMESVLSRMENSAKIIR